MPDCDCKAPVLWCDDIELFTVIIMDQIDINGDGYNVYDIIATQIDEDHAVFLHEFCDANQDGTVNKCEMFDCLVILENKYRTEKCGKDFGDLYCVNPFLEICCKDAWNCDDIEREVEAEFDAYNTDGDAKIDLNDDMHIEILEIYGHCDTDYNGTISKCELFECIVQW